MKHSPVLRLPVVCLQSLLLLGFGVYFNTIKRVDYLGVDIVLGNESLKGFFGLPLRFLKGD